MAVPFINILASSMGGIGFIELTDTQRLAEMQEKNGVPFYAGRFYPKDNKTIIEDLFDGILNANTPPWLTNKVLEPTQIWMVPAFEDERIVSTTTSIERIDVWPRTPEDTNPNPPIDQETPRHNAAVRDGWGSIGGATDVGSDGSIDPGITITQNVLPPVLLAGYLGISEISGHVSEYAFYDQELQIVNHRNYGTDTPEGVYEYIRVREDGAWKRRSTELIYDLMADDIDAMPHPTSIDPDYGWSNYEYPAEEYANWVQDGDLNKSDKYGNDYYDFFTRWIGDTPKAGLIQTYPSKIDQICLTIKVSCATTIVPDTIPQSAAEFVNDAAAGALETLGSNLSSNVWYFYWPVRLDMGNFGKRIAYLLQRQGLNKLDNPDYLPPSSVTTW
tara:strand:+ start:729 stop:1892 length:1164 start_codon:yes stop_codon:yes gene_type:complete